MQVWMKLKGRYNQMLMKLDVDETEKPLKLDVG